MVMPRLARRPGRSTMTTMSELLRECDTEATRALRIIESMPAFAWTADTTGKFTYISSNALAYLGHTRDDPGLSETGDEFQWRRVVHTDDYDRVAAKWRQCLQTVEHYDTEHRLRGADGAYRWFRNSGRPFRDSQGRITQWYGTSFDIEEQKQTEAALCERERSLRELIETLPAQIWCTGPDGQPIYFSQQFREFLGFDVADKDTPGTSRLASVLDAHIHPDDLGAVSALFARCLATGEPYALKHRQRRFDGEYRWVETRATAMRNSEGVILQWNGFCLDIEELINAQAALQANELELSQLVNMVPSHVWRLTPNGEPTFFNKRMLDYLGLDVADTNKLGMSRLEAVIATVHRDDTTEVRNTLHGCLATGEPFSMRFRLRRADGVYHWMSSRAEPLRDHEGQIVQWYGLCHEIDEQVHAEEALQRSERQLQQLIDAVPINILTFDPSGKITSLSKRFLEQVGTPPAHIEDFEALARHLVHPEDLPAMLRRVLDGFATGKPFVNRF